MTLRDMKRMKELWFKLNVIINNLRTIKERVDAETRPDLVSKLATDTSYIGLPYFTPSRCPSPCGIPCRSSGCFRSTNCKRCYED